MFKIFREQGSLLPYLSLFSLLVYLFLVGFGCQGCKKTGVPDKESGDLASILAAKLTHNYNNPDSCMKIMRSGTRLIPKHLSGLCENIIYGAFDGQSSETYLRHLDSIEAFRGSQDSHLEGVLLIHRGLKFKEMGQYDTALVCMNTAKEIFKQLNDSLYIAQTLRRMAEVYTSQSRYVASNAACVEMLIYIGNRKDLDWEYAMSGMIMCYGNQQKYQKAKDLIWETMKVAAARKDTSFLIQKYYTLAGTHLLLNNVDSALWAIDKAAYLADIHKFTEINDLMLARMGVIWRRKGNFEKGLSYSQRAVAKFDSLGNKDARVGTYNDVGHCFAMAKQWDKAEAIYLENLSALQKIKKKKVEVECYDSLVSVGLKREGNYKIWNYLKRSRELRDSLYNVEKAYIIEDLNVQYETSKKEKHIKELATQQKILRLSMIISFLLLFIALCTIAWVVYVNRQKGLLLMQENQLLAAKEQLHIVELQSHKQQLDNFRQSIFLKNHIITELETRVQTLLPTSEEVNLEYERNKRLLSEMRILTENDWKTYLSHFAKVYEGFIERVMEQFPELTQAELRLFLLLKQEADSRDIADILGISAGSVKKSRQRLRKKLVLSEEDDLEEFILKF